MGRKPAPKWSIDDVLQAFNDLPPGQRRMTKRDLYRIVSGWRDPEHFRLLFARLVAPFPGDLHRFAAEVDPHDRRKVWLTLVDRGY